MAIIVSQMSTDLQNFVTGRFLAKFALNWLLKFLLFLAYVATLPCKTLLSNLITKLDGNSWGASASTLRTSALALCYSVAEYCCPVWARSSYTNLIYTQLHSSKRLILGCLQPTQLSWLPVLRNVASPSLCRKAATDNMLQIIEAHPN